MRQSRNPDDYRIYCKLREESDKITEAAKEEHWRETCSSVDKNTSTKKLWQKINLMSKGAKNKNIPALTKPDGSLAREPQEKAEVLADHYESVCSDNSFTPKFMSHRQAFESTYSNIISDSRDHPAAFNEPFTLTELQNALLSANDSVPGEDCISISMLRHLPNSCLNVILKLFNDLLQAWIQGNLPICWKESLIGPVPKPMKDPTAAS